jgi:ABC-type multidrug transport system fused ATPase/permease subunit
VSIPESWSRYPRLWLTLLRLCWGVDRRVTLQALIGQALGVALFPAVALTLRWAVDTADRASRGQATATALVLAVVAVAVAHLTAYFLDDLAHGARLHLTDHVGLLHLDVGTIRDISRVQTMDHLERTDYLDRVTLVNGSAWQVMFSAWGAVAAIANVLRLALVLTLLGTVSPYLLLLLVFAAIPLWFDSRGRRRVVRAERGTAELIRLQRHLYKLATQAAPGKEIRVTGAGPELARRQQEAWNEAHQTRYRAQLAAATWRTGGWAVFTLGFGAALALVLYRARHGQSSLGEIVLAITVATNLRDAVQRAVATSTDAASTSRLIDPYLWLKEYAAAQERDNGLGHPAPTRLREGITLEHLTYRYPGTERDALTDVSVTLPAGSVVALVGEFGSGKSTLVKLLCKFHRPDSGAIRVDGADLADIDAGSWWGGSAVAFQDFGRYQASFRDVVGIGDLSRLDDDAAVHAALADADAEVLLNRLPDGLDSQLGREFGGAELSEGQWQKTALARACMRRQPLLFVLDEPTASLDAPSEQAIFERYFARARQLAQRTGAITVIVSHRFSTVAGADLILVLEKGRLVQAGTHGDLLTDTGPYAELHAITTAAYTG